MNKVIAVLCIIFLAIGSLNAYGLPSFDEVKRSYLESEAVILDRHGKVIHEMRIDPNGRRLEWAKIKDISPVLIKAVIFSEDRRFYEHDGVDWKAVGSALIANVFSKNPRGASTITMQLASLLDKELKPKGSKRTMSQKWDQMKAAQEIEKKWSKDEIIESYLNLIFFRGELQGISSASRGLFDKDPSGLNELESLMLAVLIRSPNASSKIVSKRACLLGQEMELSSECKEINSMVELFLGKPYAVRYKNNIAPHAGYWILKHIEYKLLSQHPPLNSLPSREGNLSYASPLRGEGKGEGDLLQKNKIYTTIDADLQIFALESLRRKLISEKSQNMNDGAVLIVENKTGEIFAYIANSGTSPDTKYVDGIQAKRQAGSTLKPFIYATAFEKQVLTPASVLKDSPLEISTESGIYKPENYTRDFKGDITARTALASSLNIPAVRSLSLAGTNLFLQKLKLAGFDNLKTDDYYGLSIALGTADISLYKLVNAYRTLANKGMWSELRFKNKSSKKNSRSVFSEEAAFLVSDILSDRQARSGTFGFENVLSTKFWSAVKTGTSKDMRDNWCIGYSEKYTVGVWVGNFSGEPMWNVSGITGAAPVWSEIMNYLHKNQPSKGPAIPSGITTKKIRFSKGIEPEREEFFIKGTEPVTAEIDNSPSAVLQARIIYPVEHMIVALDPDIPVEQQVIFFEALPHPGILFWKLNDNIIGKVSETISWKPTPGVYNISLVDIGNKTVDSVVFSVRGN